MKYVSDESDVVKEDAKFFYYNQNGIMSDPGRHVAFRKVSDDQTVSYVLVYKGTLYDPKDKAMPKDKVYKSVSKECFNKYINYLTSGAFYDYEKAEREFRKVR